MVKVDDVNKEEIKTDESVKERRVEIILDTLHKLAALDLDMPKPVVGSKEVLYACYSAIKDENEDHLARLGAVTILNAVFNGSGDMVIEGITNEEFADEMVKTLNLLKQISKTEENEYIKGAARDGVEKIDKRVKEFGKIMMPLNDKKIEEEAKKRLEGCGRKKALSGRGKRKSVVF